MVTIGACRSAKICGEWDTDLANGWCRSCWDRKND